jgi:hypothetical protein
MSGVTRRIVVVVLTGALTALAAIGVAVTTPLGFDARDVVEVERNANTPDLPPGQGGDHPGKGRPGDPEDPNDPGEVGPAIPDDVTTVRVGTAHRSLEPAPDGSAGERWVTEHDACATLSEATIVNLLGGDLSMIDHLASTGSPWPNNPDCIYMGGYGIGPMNPITHIHDDHGLGVRGVAILDDDDTALVLVVVDAVGWFWEYGSKCSDCGIRQITERMGDELDIDPSGIVVASTHSHTAPDFMGGWGFVPDWYMAQATRAIEDVIRDAVTSARPAVLEVGEEIARSHNRERRGTYRSAEEAHVAWLRALAVQDGRFVMDNDRGTPQVVATVGAFAAHPTTASSSGGEGHGDWPVVFEEEVASRFGGMAMHMMTGLGNLSASGGTNMGRALAQELPPAGSGTLLADTRIRTTRITYRQPATNVPLTALGIPGFFDRKIDLVPAELRTGKNPSTAPCVSASLASAEVPVAAAMIGSGFALTTGPGEIFANLSNTIKEQSPAPVTMPLGQANDALGYLPQSFEISPVGQQGLGFVAGGFVIVNYEDSYAIDRCFGDKVLETSRDLLADLNAR